MRVISKKIAYNDFVSKLPGIIPSIMDSWSIPQLYQNCGKHSGEETYFTYASAIKRASEYNINASQLKYEAQFVHFDENNLIEFTVGNYGLIPSDVIIPKEISDIITDYTDIYVNLPDGNGGFYDLSWPKKKSDPHYEGRKIISGGTEIKILTYYTLNKWYAFFKKYYELVNHPDYPRFYETAIDYYNKEVIVKNEEQEAYYQSLDDMFNSRGGKKMYNWISNNCIIQYQIPKNFTDEWNTTYLYYPDAIKWYYWFKIRNEKYKNVSVYEDCVSDNLKGSDCCDCTEYIRLGGNDFYVNLKEWIDTIEINSDIYTNSASVTIPISITNTIDDLGEMAIFSNKWVGGTDYHNTLSEIEPGTVISEPKEDFDTTLYDTYIISGGTTHKGYYYNDYYENVFKENDWGRYIDYYISKNKKEFVSSGLDQNEEINMVTAFTYSPLNGKVIYNPINVTENIKINKAPIVCINGNNYEVIDGKYVELCYATNNIADLKYKKRTKLPVLTDGDIEYVIFNGKRKYVETDPEDPSKEIIYFLKEIDCHDDGCIVKSGKYIIYDSCLYLIENNSVKIDGENIITSYPVLDGYFKINDNIFYVSGVTVVLQDGAIYNENSNTYVSSFRELNNEELIIFNIDKFEILDEGSYVKIFYKFEKHYCNVVSGFTDSKLDILRRKEVTTDDLGNELPGYFKSVVDISSLVKQSKYNLPYDECTLDILYKVGEVSDLKFIKENEFLGNIITDIKFYFIDNFGNDKIVYHAYDDDALEAIRKCENDYESYDGNDIVNVMMCDITYHLGAVINKNGSKYSMDSSTHTGVKYVDTVYVLKQVGTYYLNVNKQFTFKYYLLTQNVDTISITDFSADVIHDASTYFEMDILIYNIDGKYDNKFSAFEKNNGIIAYPLFRNEFNLGSSLPQNIESNIYIDRGISAAYEKQLKLQEFRTMEALENYGNGWFKINNY